MSDAVVVPPPKVFLSYSHTSDEHKDWVVRLAERLAGDGVHVVADFWDLKEGHDLNAFMEQMVTDPTVTRVLAVCDARYAKKANERSGGVGTESQIISQQVYERVAQEKFIPLVRERNDDGRAWLPVFFASRLYLDFSDDELFGERYDQLLRNLFGRPERKRPPLGKPPADLFAEDLTPSKAAGKLTRLREAFERNKPHAAALANEYLETLAASLEDYRIDHTREATTPLAELVVESVRRFRPARDTFLDFATLLADYLDTSEVHDHVHAFLERLLAFQDQPPHLQTWREGWADNYHFLTRELFLSLVTVLVGRRKYATAARYVAGECHVAARHERGILPRGYDAFDEPARILDAEQSSSDPRPPGTAVLVRERATHPQAKYEALVQCDILLFLFPHLRGEEASGFGWWPRLLGSDRDSNPLDLFVRATSPRGLEPFHALFGIRTLGELAGRLKTLLLSKTLQQLRPARFWPVDWPRLLNWNAIEQAAQR